MLFAAKDIKNAVAKLFGGESFKHLSLIKGWGVESFDCSGLSLIIHSI